VNCITAKSQVLTKLLLIIIVLFIYITFYLLYHAAAHTKDGHKDMKHKTSSISSKIVTSGIIQKIIKCTNQMIEVNRTLLFAYARYPQNVSTTCINLLLWQGLDSAAGTLLIVAHRRPSPLITPPPCRAPSIAPVFLWLLCSTGPPCSSRSHVESACNNNKCLV